MKRIILVVFLAGLLSACAHNITAHGTKGTPQTVALLAVTVNDEEDNSQLKGNEFLRRDIEKRIIEELTSLGFKCLLSSDTVTKPSHVLTIRSKGVENRTHVIPINSTPNYVTGGTNISGGGTRATNIVHAVATLTKWQSDKYEKIAIAYADGNGEGFIGESWNNALHRSNQLSDIYQEVFMQAALSLFE